MRQIRVTIGPQVFAGTLEEERAPATCAAFLRLLPLSATLLHARWSGEAGWVPLGELDAGVGAERTTHRPLPGQVLFYPAGASETEILVPYGVTAFAAQSGPLAGNHFLTLANCEPELTEMGRRLLWDGAQDISFELLTDQP